MIWKIQIDIPALQLSKRQIFQFDRCFVIYIEYITCVYNSTPYWLHMTVKVERIHLHIRMKAQTVLTDGWWKSAWKTHKFGRTEFALSNHGRNFYISFDVVIILVVQCVCSNKFYFLSSLLFIFRHCIKSLLLCKVIHL